MAAYQIAAVGFGKTVTSLAERRKQAADFTKPLSKALGVLETSDAIRSED